MSSDVKAGGGEPRRWLVEGEGLGHKASASGPRMLVGVGVDVIESAAYEEVCARLDAVVRERDEARAERDAARERADHLAWADDCPDCKALRERVRVLAEALEAASPWVGYDADIPEVKAQIAAALASVADSDPEGACPDCNGKGGEHEDRGGLTSEAVPCQTCGGTGSSSSGGVTPEGRGEAYEDGTLEIDLGGGRGCTIVMGGLTPDQVVASVAHALGTDLPASASGGEGK